MSTAQTGAILGGLQKVNGILTLATTAADVIIPIVSGIIKDIKQKVNADGTVEYTVVLQTGMAELDDIKKTAKTDLEAINAYLVSKGEKPIPIPADDPATPPATDASKS